MGGGVLNKERERETEGWRVEGGGRRGGVGSQYVWGGHIVSHLGATNRIPWSLPGDSDLIRAVMNQLKSSHEAGLVETGVALLVETAGQHS